MNLITNNHFLQNRNKIFNFNLSLISYFFRKLEDSSSHNTTQTSISDNKKQQLKELYIYIAVLAGIIIIILVGYALYRKCVERKVLAQLELDYQLMIYNILNSMSSQVSSSEVNSQPRSYNGNANYVPNFDMRSEDINSENDYHEERMEHLRKKYGNRILIKCLLKKHVETVEYTKKLEETFGDKCTICMDGFQIGENIYKTPCEHIFHIKCFDKYLNGINKRDKLVCPNCNQNLLINKKFLKLRAKKVEVKNTKIINKEDNGKEIIINNSSESIPEKDIEEIEKEKEKERAEIIYIKRITRNANKEIKENREDNIYNPLKLRKSSNFDKKEDINNKSKKSIIFANNDLKKSADSKGVLYYGRNNNPYMNKMNSERRDIMPEENENEEEKKES